MKTRKALVCLLLAAGTASAQKPPVARPTGAVLVTAKVGQCESMIDKYTVVVAATVVPKKTSISIQLRDATLESAQGEVDPAKAEAIGALLQQASDKLLAGERFTGQQGMVEVATIEEGGKRAVQVKFRTTASSHTHWFDPYNAARLAELITNAKQVADWLTPKLATLE